MKSSPNGKWIYFVVWKELFKLAKQDGKLDKTHNRIYLIFLPDKKEAVTFFERCLFLLYPEFAFVMMDCELEICKSELIKSFSSPEWGWWTQVHLRDGHQEEVDPSQQQPHHAGHQGEVIFDQWKWQNQFDRYGNLSNILPPSFPFGTLLYVSYFY